MRATALTLALLAACAAAAVGPAAVTGEQRVLIVNVTWGPEPWTREHAQASLDEAAEFIRSASFGKTWVVGETTPWLRVFAAPIRECDLDLIASRANAAAARSGYELSRYTKIGYAFPHIPCPWAGAYYPPGIWFNEAMHRHVVAHELGHTYGVTEEGPGWRQGAATNYASPYSVMGHGLGDFNAFEKIVYGWLDRVARPTPGDLTLGAIDRPSTHAQALNVLTAGDEYWFEYRPPLPLWPTGTEAEPGVVVTAGPNGLGSTPSRYPQRNLTLLDVGGSDAAALDPGQRFAVPGGFTVTVKEATADAARIQFAWSDSAPPAPPRLTVASRAITWSAPRERGSGVASYELVVDGRRRTIPAIRYVADLAIEADRELTLGRGRHRVSVVAIDRAGNRSAPARVTVRM